MIYQPIYLHSYLRSEFCPVFKFLTNQSQRPNPTLWQGNCPISNYFVAYFPGNFIMQMYYQLRNKQAKKPEGRKYLEMFATRSLSITTLF